MRSLAWNRKRKQTLNETNWTYVKIAMGGQVTNIMIYIDFAMIKT